MKILNRVKIEDCFDGSAVYVYELSEPWTEPRARRLAALGHFQYFADFLRPLFRLRTEAGLFVNGVAGARDCRVVLPRTNREHVQRELEAMLVGGCAESPCDSISEGASQAPHLRQTQQNNMNER
jgi:hypothetical protein